MSRRWEDLLEQVARERYQRLVAHATLVSASPSDAQDLVQESLIAAFSGRARFGSVEQAEAYVRRAIASRAIDAGRRRTREYAASGARCRADARGGRPSTTGCRARTSSGRWRR